MDGADISYTGGVSYVAISDAAIALQYLTSQGEVLGIAVVSADGREETAVICTDNTHIAAQIEKEMNFKSRRLFI